MKLPPYAELLGITTWKVMHCGPAHVTNSTTYGSANPHLFSSAFGVHEESGLVFQLIQPRASDGSTYAEFLATRGEGLHSVCTISVV